MEEKCSDGGQDQDGTPDYDCQIKAGLAVGRMYLIRSSISRPVPGWRLALATTLPVISTARSTARPALPLLRAIAANTLPNRQAPQI
jgi:hypothetical protein